MLFHAGALWRLNELGYLPRLDRISSVSGGSITAGVLASGWSKLTSDQNRVASNYQEVVVAPLRGLAGRTVDMQREILVAVRPNTDVVSRLLDRTSRRERSAKWRGRTW
jgi:NTE family protein